MLATLLLLITALALALPPEKLATIEIRHVAKLDWPFSLAATPRDMKNLENITTTINKTSNAPNNSGVKQISVTAHINYNVGVGSRPTSYRACNCGVRNPAGYARIYNGELAKVNEFPWRVSINPTQNPQLSFCAGALIHKEWVLTSASCVYQRSVDSILVDLGDHNLQEDRETPNVYVGVTHKIIHGGYVPPPMLSSRYPNNAIETHDIALLKLAEPIEEDNIMPVCLPKGGLPDDLAPGSQVITSGWGVTGPEGTSRELRRVALTYVPSEQFRGEIVPRYFPRLKAPPHDGLLYTFDYNKGIYPIDHGTTLEFVNVTNGLYYALGVADAVQVNDVGYGVKHMVGAWTDLTQYLRWVDQQTGNAVFCEPN